MVKVAIAVEVVVIHKITIAIGIAGVVAVGFGVRIIIGVATDILITHCNQENEKCS